MNPDRLELGRAQREAVLGADHVAAASAGTTDFNAALQRLVTEYCWGTVWSRPELGRRERSLITVSILAALGRWEELELHVAGAIRNGATESDLRELILHVGVYAGIPAALAANRVAVRVLGAHEK